MKNQLKNTRIDQTSFQDEMSIMRQSQGEKVERENTVQFVNKSNLPRTALLMLLIVGLISAAVVFFTKGNTTEPVLPIPSATPQVINQQESDIEKQMKLLETIVEEADPSNNNLPLPPISYDLSISKTE